MGRRRKKPTAVHTSWEPWVSFDCRGLGDFDIASQYYLFPKGIFCLGCVVKHFHRGTKNMSLITSCGVLLNGQYAVVKLIVPLPNPYFWFPVMSWAGLDVSPPRWPWSPVVLTRVVSILVLEKMTEQLFERKANTDWRLDSIAGKALPCSPRLCCPAAEWNLLFWV